MCYIVDINVWGGKHMARVNQGIYKQYKEQKDQIISSWDEIKGKYWGNIEFSGDYSELFDFMYDVNWLYESAKSIVIKYSNLLESQKFENEENIKKYRDYIRQLQNCMSDMKAYASETRKKIGNDLTEQEAHTLENFQI